MHKNFPEYVKLGTSCIRYDEDYNCYYRHAGNWRVHFRLSEHTLYSVSHVKSLNNIELIPVTEEEWRKCNNNYIPDSPEPEKEESFHPHTHIRYVGPRNVEGLSYKKLYRLYSEESYILLIDDDLGKQHIISWDQDTKEIQDPDWEWPSAISKLNKKSTPPLELTENTMTNACALNSDKKTNALNITNPTMINGIDADSLSDEELVDLIALQEKKINSLKNLKADSKKVKTFIKKHQDSIALLVGILDARE